MGLFYVGCSGTSYVLSPTSVCPPTPQPSQADPEAALGGLGHSVLPQRSPLDALPLRTGSHVTGMHVGCRELPPQRDTQYPTVSVPGNTVRKKPAQRYSEIIHIVSGGAGSGRTRPRLQAHLGGSWGSPIQQLPLCQVVGEPRGALEAHACPLSTQRGGTALSLRVGRQRGKKTRPWRTLPRIGWELPELVVRIRESLLDMGGRGSLVPKGRPGIIPGRQTEGAPRLQASAMPTPTQGRAGGKAPPHPGSGFK